MKENTSKDVTSTVLEISTLAQQLQVIMGMALNADQDHQEDAPNLCAAVVTAKEVFEKIERLADSIG